MWRLRMLGRFEVLSPEGRLASFRSRKVGSLLAFLALNKGRSISNSTLQDLLWPESDGDRQSQSLRRAIADLRDALEVDSARGALVHTESGSAQLESDAFEIDVDQFEEFLQTGAGAENYESHVSSALALYGGPLLAPLDDDWIFAYRRKFEEDFCRAVVEFCDYLGRRGQGKEAARIAHAAIILAPFREEPYVASIRAYATQDIRASALRQFEALEQMLDDEFGQTPSEAALAALDSPAFQAHAYQVRDDSSGGALDAESRFYIERDADRTVSQALDSGESVVLLYGPRQVGKTSLLARKANSLRAKGESVVATDFQSLGRSEVERQSTFYRALVHSLATQLEQDYEPSWNEWVGPNSNLNGQVESLLKHVQGPICWAMDEVDRVFGTEYADDFFGLIRSWHNRRALDPDGPWKRLRLLISYATEAQLFIKDLNQSPFNVGVRVNLRDFNESEVEDLGGRYEFEGGVSAAVFEITRGHPFLTRRAFGFLRGGRTIEELQEAAPKEDGPFGEHLKRLLDAIRRDSETEQEVRLLLDGGQIRNNGLRQRLVSSGLIVPLEAGDRFRSSVYADYLTKALTKI